MEEYTDIQLIFVAMLGYFLSTSSICINADDPLEYKHLDSSFFLFKDFLCFPSSECFRNYYTYIFVMSYLRRPEMQTCSFTISSQTVLSYLRWDNPCLWLNLLLMGRLAGVGVHIGSVCSARFILCVQSSLLRIKFLTTKISCLG